MDEEFSNLCQDYDDAIDALHHWQNSRDRNAPKLVEEYVAAIRELEAEIREAATRWQPAP